MHMSFQLVQKLETSTPPKLVDLVTKANCRPTLSPSYNGFTQVMGTYGVHVSGTHMHMPYIVRKSGTVS